MPNDFWGGVTGSASNFGAFLLQNIGWVSVIGVLVLFYLLNVKAKKGLIYTVFFVFVVGPLVVQYAPALWVGGGIDGAQSGQSVACKKLGPNSQACVGQPGGPKAANYSNPDNSGSLTGNPATSGNGGSSSSSSQQGILGGEQPTTDTVVTVLKKNAIDLWFQEKMGCVSGECFPGNWLSNATDLGFVPEGVTARVTCVSGCAAWDLDRNKSFWKIEFIPDDNLFIDLSQVMTNWWVAGDKRTFAGSTSSSVTVRGLGKWGLCKQCSETVTIPGKKVAAPEASPAAGATETAPAQQQEQQQSTTTSYLCTDATGCDTRKPVNNSCDGKGVGAGTIKKGDPVEVLQVFTGAAPFSYNNSSDLGLTNDNRCIFMGTVTKK